MCPRQQPKAVAEWTEFWGVDSQTHQDDWRRSVFVGSGARREVAIMRYQVDPAVVLGEGAARDHQARERERTSKLHAHLHGEGTPVNIRIEAERHDRRPGQTT